ncbi:MAG: hypothetical protein Q8847_02640 [Sweet potato little leaf phytoplasma]|nr:hypothetical protein [Sweet potato little leaf phytoplasma]
MKQLEDGFAMAERKEDREVFSINGELGLSFRNEMMEEENSVIDLNLMEEDVTERSSETEKNRAKYRISSFLEFRSGVPNK